MKRYLSSEPSIRQWTALLVLACILPAVLGTTALIYFSYLRERTNLERAAIELTHTLSQAVDLELASAGGALEALSTSPSLAQGDLQAFQRQALEVALQRDGNDISLFDANGKALFHTGEPFEPNADLYGRTGAERRLARTPVISDLRRPGRDGGFITSVDLAVEDTAGNHFILSMQFQPERFNAVLFAQHIRSDRVASLLDSSGIVVARTRDLDRFLGKPATPELRLALAEQAEGSVEEQTVDGIPSVAAFSRSELSNWTVVVAVHRAAFAQPLRITLFRIVFGAILLFAATMGLGIVIARRIENAFFSLTEPAIALGQGRPFAMPALRLREARQVGEALLEAAQLLRRRTEERDSAERTERELREAKRQVEQNEAFLRGVFEQSPDPVLLVAPDGRILGADGTAARLFAAAGWDEAASRIDDVLFSDPACCVLSDVLASVTVRTQLCVTSQLYVRRPDGSTCPVDVRASPFDGQQGRLVIVTVRDVSARVRTENALRESEKRFRSTMENAPIGMALVGMDGRWLDVNHALCEMLGYGKAELTQLGFQDVTFHDDIELDYTHAQTLLNGAARSYQIEKRYLHKDGTVIPVLVTGSLVRDGNGAPVHFIAQIQDIRARKRAEEALGALARRLELATRAGHIGVWDLELATGRLDWDDRMHALYGTSRAVDDGNYAMWRTRVHPDDLARVEAEVEIARAGTGEFATEFRIIRPNGQMRTVRASALLTRDPDGRPLRFTGVNIDVTEDRAKEAAIANALREKEILLKELYHRVKNNLQVITSLLSLQMATLPDGPARTALMESVGRVRAMALVHEKLYQSGRLSSISLRAYITDLCMQLGQAASIAQRGIAIQTEVAALEVGLDIAVPLGLLLNELVSNSLKHAFPEGRRGIVRVQAGQVGALLRLTVRDDGIGLPEKINSTFAQTLGLKLVAALASQLGGRFSLESGNGACATVEFPYGSMRDQSRRVDVKE